ncbi:MAG: glycosyltransferase family 4 protein [Chloroflexota bacterium]|nr:glycosyltransferase family 4 protein [Chloroflexota bacterium]
MNKKPLDFQKTSVCIVGPFPPRDGDVAIQAELLSRSLAQEGATVRQVNTDVGLVRRLPVIGIHLLPLVQVPLVVLRLLLAVPRCDIVHAYAASYWGFYLPVVLAWLLGRLFGRRVVMTYTGGAGATFLEQSSHWVFPLWRRMDAVAVTSEYLQGICRRYGLDATVVSTLIPLEHFPFTARESWPPMVIWTGPLEPHANPTMALRTLALLQQTVPETRLLMTGQGALADEVNRLAHDTGVAHTVAYLPWLPTHQRHQLIQQASVIWVTALEDNLPQSLLEAAACGTVVVGTDVGGIPELLHDGVDALLVRPNDAERMAAGTAQVLRRPVLAKGLAKNARLSVERFTWEQVREGIAQLYFRVAGDERPDAPQQRFGGLPWSIDDVEGHTEFLWSEPNSEKEEVDSADTGANASRRG